jgi:hypothetical protein
LEKGFGSSIRRNVPGHSGASMEWGQSLVCCKLWKATLLVLAGVMQGNVGGASEDWVQFSVLIKCWGEKGPNEVLQ